MAGAVAVVVPNLPRERGTEKLSRERRGEEGPRTKQGAKQVRGADLLVPLTPCQHCCRQHRTSPALGQHPSSTINRKVKAGPALVCNCRIDLHSSLAEANARWAEVHHTSVDRGSAGGLRDTPDPNTCWESSHRSRPRRQEGPRCGTQPPARCDPSTPATAAVPRLVTPHRTPHHRGAPPPRTPHHRAPHSASAALQRDAPTRGMPPRGTPTTRTGVLEAGTQEVGGAWRPGEWGRGGGAQTAYW